MSREIANHDCTACLLHSGCAFVCEMLPIANIHHADLMVVGDYPTSSDDQLELAPMTETKFYLFWQIAGDVCGVDRNNVYAT